MLHSKASNFAILAAVCLMGIGAATSSANSQWATEWSGGSVVKLGGSAANPAMPVGVGVSVGMETVI